MTKGFKTYGWKLQIGHPGKEYVNAFVIEQGSRMSPAQAMKTDICRIIDTHFSHESHSIPESQR